ncbi:flagellar brake protein, partial [Burkholderia gladioli]|uniref:PilZ domain-containing protein n=1 Tax=Burkholderia gladioli TaxID=28095 RepID=UPI000BBCFAC7|nr:PilZ domain-containing protein [Burkholderia gladioli]ATF89122.1 pilus assembly protein PilZ [Burkholderia gladioli pv. gladioli]MBJ9715591.1 PilZ domain-containing protein [Burkholderia gladioli]MBU9156331.1 flagellar brake protein [Burkholderia gladioli]MCH7274631.1 flagellar brake protein [Burkholderia gladioli]MDR8089161.1 flagellar brake protein [Burkholderia gladioli]
MSENRSVLRLAESDLTAGEPLPWPLFDAGGAPLMQAGASLDAEEIAFLFARFAPARRADGDAPQAAPQACEVPDGAAPRLSLPADATLGLRRRAGSTRQMSRFRVLGVHPAGPLFVRPLQPRAVDLTPGEAIEAMAIGRSAVYWFTAFVEAVAFEPAPYLILSAPGKLKRVRERRDTRVAVRLAARYVLSSARGTGLVLDVSPSGLSIAVDRELGKAGESLRVTLPVAASDGAVEALTLTGSLRGLTHQLEAEPAWLHHVALDAMAEADLMRLKAALFDWSLSA